MLKLYIISEVLYIYCENPTSVARNLFKAARSTIEGNPDKVSKNLGKAFVGALISGGFTLMTFFPALAWVGGILVFIATGSFSPVHGPRDDCRIGSTSC